MYFILLKCEKPLTTSFPFVSWVPVVFVLAPVCVFVFVPVFVSVVVPVFVSVFALPFSLAFSFPFYRSLSFSFPIFVLSDISFSEWTKQLIEGQKTTAARVEEDLKALMANPDEDIVLRWDGVGVGWGEQGGGRRSLCPPPHVEKNIRKIALCSI